jgi:hypothetical protein
LEIAMKKLPEYEHRSCLACQKRIPRWTDGKLTPSTKVFCSPGCGRFYRRMSVLSGRARERKIEPIKPAFREAVLPPRRSIEGQPEFGPCQACGRPCQIKPDKPTYCNARCEAYVPLPPRKRDGDWFIVVGPVDYCHDCSLAIMPHKPHGFVTPYRGAGGDLFCSHECRKRRASGGKPPKIATTTENISDTAEIEPDSGSSNMIMPVATDMAEMPTTGWTAGRPA